MARFIDNLPVGLEVNSLRQTFVLPSWGRAGQAESKIRFA
jgi:hypothetical protein